MNWKKADLLLQLLQHQMKCHLATKVPTSAQRNHISMQIAYKNLAVTAADMVLANHIKKDLSCLDETSGLLATTTANFKHVSNFPHLWGAYLSFDDNRSDFA